MEEVANLSCEPEGSCIEEVAMNRNVAHSNLDYPGNAVQSGRKQSNVKHLRVRRNIA